MKKSSKWLGTTLSAVLIASLLSPAYGSAAAQTDLSGIIAKDLTGHWAQASVQKWLSSGLIQAIRITPSALMQKSRVQSSSRS
ncbi:hypothetical protein CM49_03179 [Paenibacillus sp. P1XP2]|nr:hypothetical protein CM49_03179 [Paenibacillus sp. P1XP2]